MPDLDAELRALLVCPVCRGELVDVPRGLLCPVDELVFPVLEGLPVMLPEEALEPTAAERAAAEE